MPDSPDANMGWTFFGAIALPILTCWYLKTALLYLVAALIMAVIIASGDVLAAMPCLSSLTPIYIHFLVLGWLSQLIFGVAYWMFPKLPAGLNPVVYDRSALASFFLLNVGLLLRAISEPLTTQVPMSGPALAVSGFVQLAGAVCFVFSIWPRIRGK